MIPNKPEVVTAVQDVLDTVDLHRPLTDHPAAHEFMDAIQKHFEEMLAKIQADSEAK